MFRNNKKYYYAKMFNFIYVRVPRAIPLRNEFNLM